MKMELLNESPASGEHAHVTLHERSVLPEACTFEGKAERFLRHGGFGFYPHEVALFGLVGLVGCFFCASRKRRRRRESERKKFFHVRRILFVYFFPVRLQRIFH
jgi:hypothetical protein